SGVRVQTPSRTRMRGATVDGRERAIPAPPQAVTVPRGRHGDDAAWGARRVPCHPRRDGVPHLPDTGAIVSTSDAGLGASPTGPTPAPGRSLRGAGRKTAPGPPQLVPIWQPG